MLIINRYANNKFFKVVSDNVGTSKSYGSPPVHYWYRNVIEAVRLIDQGATIRQGSYTIQLDKNLGIAYYTVTYLNNQSVYIVTDFDFNFRTLQSYLRRGQTSGRKTNSDQSQSLWNNQSKQLKRSVTIGGNQGQKIECCEFTDGTIRLQYKGKNTPLKTQFDQILSPFRNRKDGYYAIGVKNNVKYKLFANDTTQPLSESRYRQIIHETEPLSTPYPSHRIRLTESDLRHIITASVRRILCEYA